MSAEGNRIIVMKFGGTSVGTADGRRAILARVTELLEAGARPVVVVSAMGRAGDPYATDTLLSLADGIADEPRERDLLASVGEVISATVVARDLRMAGVDATALTGSDAGILTDETFGSARIERIEPSALVATISAGVVPVVAGFQGIAPSGSVTTLGRGGSDTTACALGVALDADEVQIYTDVDGVMTADPRACAGAEVLETIRADELFQMARHGSRVMHTPAAELALAAGLNVRIRNTYSDHPGTKVADIAAFRPSTVATAVSHASGIVRFRAALAAQEGTSEHTSRQSEVYQALADAGVSLDMFTPAGDCLLFNVTSSESAGAAEVLERLGIAYETLDGLAKVTLIGAGMHGVPGVMARMAAALSAADAHVYQTADSHTTISALIDEPDLGAALDALHSEFQLGDRPCSAD